MAGLVRDLPTLPGVQSLSLATRYIEGGRERFIEFVQLAMLNKAEAAIKWMAVYADLTAAERLRVSYDDVCAAAGVMPSEIMSAVVSNAMTFGVDVGNFVAAITHPQVVQAAVRAAKDPAGLEDRRMMFQHQGFIPTPKGTTINVNAHASSNAQAAAVAAKDPSVPSFADDLRNIRAVEGTILRALPPAQPAETFEVDDSTEFVGVSASHDARDYVGAPDDEMDFDVD